MACQCVYRQTPTLNVAYDAVVVIHCSCCCLPFVLLPLDFFKFLSYLRPFLSSNSSSCRPEVNCAADRPQILPLTFGRFLLRYPPFFLLFFSPRENDLIWAGLFTKAGRFSIPSLERQGGPTIDTILTLPPNCR